MGTGCMHQSFAPNELVPPPTNAKREKKWNDHFESVNVQEKHKQVAYNYRLRICRTHVTRIGKIWNRIR